MKNILMCRPDYFDIEYEINPWMHKENQVNHSRAMKQWQVLYDAYKEYGVEVELIEQIKGLPDMTFTANGGIVSGNTFVVNKHRFKERAGEERYFEEWFKGRGFKTYRLKYFQGGEGDALFFRDILYMGYGFRSDRESHDEVAQILGIKTISLRLIDPYFYDFDTAFCPLGDKAVLYYPLSFDPPSRKKVMELPGAIAMTKIQAESFIGNSVLVGDILFAGYKDSDLEEKLKPLGIGIKMFDMSEFKKSGGGIKCLTLYMDH
ncbi:amidinotransferase [Candidatus Gottesmanbacteria bacterium]|nr:amidinotransferase [Candidatus Roizmanbacteria bacterium]MBI4067009.1 amidinotransferase [Candidatus Gottesmanbacteria bacterium]